MAGEGRARQAHGALHVLGPHERRVAADPARHVEWLRRDAALGVDLVSLHHVGGEQERFIDEFGARVLPQLRR